MEKTMESKEQLMTESSGNQMPRRPEETSQRTEDWRKGTKTTDRDGLKSMD